MAGQNLFSRSFTFLSKSRLLLGNRTGLVNLPSIMNFKSETRDRLKQLEIPEKPKRPLTPYIRFITEKHNIIAKENPNWKQSQVFKKCAEDWKTVNNELKEKYNELYKSESKIYEEQILNFEASLSEEQRDAIKTARTEKKQDKQKRKLRKLIKATNKPKRPPTPFLRYYMDQINVRNVAGKQLTSILKEDWANLPDSEKQTYTDQYLKEKEEFESNLKEWEMKMIYEGHQELVRAKSLDIKIPSRIRQVKKVKPQ